MSLTEEQKAMTNSQLINMLPTQDQPQYVMVTTTQTFAHTYIIPVDQLDGSNPEDEACKQVMDSCVREASQKWLGEHIISADVLPMSKAVEAFDKNSPYLSGWTLDQKIEYMNNWKEQ